MVASVNPFPDRPGADGESSADGPRLELDELLAQLIDRARDVMGAQGRLRGLLHANQMIVGNLALPVVLRRIVEAACELVNARYGALGVIAPNGSLEQFVHVGMDAQTVSKIGHLPEGKGLLGALIQDPRPIRLQTMTGDPRSVGFPPNHPPMGSFLGVPIRVRDEVYGNLYLTGHEDAVTAEDEELVLALAATAGVAIENARLFDESRRRQEWLQASTEITRQLLANEGEEPLQVIARRLHQIAGADAVNVVLPTPDGQHLIVEIATGEGADQLAGVSYPSKQTVSQLVIENGRPVLVGDIRQEQHHTVHLSQVAAIGPLMALPLVGTERVRGALIVARLEGRARFTVAELEMATTFANQAAVAVELADARADQQRMTLLEDRDRIGRDLHDHVIQRLFGVGLTVESIASGLSADPRGDRLAQVVTDIDATIRQIRTTIFQLRGPLAPYTGGVRAQVLEVAAELTVTLGFQPSVTFAGPVDFVVPDAVIGELSAVVRETLSNTARHAKAEQVMVSLSVGKGVLCLEVTDDGVGMGETDRRSGLANLRERAALHHGTLLVTSPFPDRGCLDSRGGTNIRWTIPLN